MCWYGCVDLSLCVAMGVWMNHYVLAWVCGFESVCVGKGVWMNHYVLVWVCG